jgi:PadR family transcriptional regulator, regulatory protein PadR
VSVDANSPWLAQLRKGVVELLVLALLRARGPLHGYGIVQALEESGDLIAGVSTVYPVLKRLEADGLLDAAWGAGDEAGRRRNYAITDAGERFLEDGSRQFDELHAALGRIGGAR